MKRNRIISIIMCMVLAVCMMPAAVFADESRIAINEENFPDDYYRSYVSRCWDFNRDGFLSEMERSHETWIDFSGHREITTLKGIEFFPNLKEIICDSCSGLTELDVSQNLRLETLDCDLCTQLSDLDLTKNAELATLDCSSCGITQLDLSGCPALKSLSCGGTRITELDLSANPELEALNCGGIGITELDLSYNTKLERLSIGDNGFSTFDLNQYPWITRFTCYNENQPTEIIVDLSVRQNIEYFGAYNCILPDLVISAGNQFTQLRVMFCDIERISVTGGETVYSIICEGNENLKELYINDIPDLLIAYLVNNGLETLQFNNTKVQSIYCSGNNLTSLDLNCDTLSELICFGNELTSLDLSNLPNLKRLICCDNELETIDLSHSANLKELDCSGNRLKELDLSNNTLDILECDDNEIEELILSRNHGFVQYMEDIYMERTGDEESGYVVTYYNNEEKEDRYSWLSFWFPADHGNYAVLRYDEETKLLFNVNVTANFHDNNYTPAYGVTGNVITVTSIIPCKLGYIDGYSNKYVNADAVSNEDGTHSFTVPEGVEDAVLVFAGDINGDGKISNADATRIKASLTQALKFSKLQRFAVDANGDGMITNADAVMVKAVLKGIKLWE